MPTALLSLTIATCIWEKLFHSPYILAISVRKPQRQFTHQIFDPPIKKYATHLSTSLNHTRYLLLGYTQIISRQNNNVWSSLFNKTGRSLRVTTNLETFESPVQRGILLSAKLLYVALIRVFYNYQL